MLLVPAKMVTSKFNSKKNAFFFNLKETKKLERLKVSDLKMDCLTLKYKGCPKRNTCHFITLINNIRHMQLCTYV